MYEIAGYKTFVALNDEQLRLLRQDINAFKDIVFEHVAFAPNIDSALEVLWKQFRPSTDAEIRKFAHLDLVEAGTQDKIYHITITSITIVGKDTYQESITFEYTMEIEPISHVERLELRIPLEI